MRLKTAGLLLSAGLGAYALEKLLPANGFNGLGALSKYRTEVVVGTFATETIVNVVGVIDDVRHGDGGHDSHDSLLHNSTDAATSAVTTGILLAPELVDLSIKTAEAASSAGHLGVMGALTLHSVYAAMTSKLDSEPSHSH